MNCRGESSHFAKVGVSNHMFLFKCIDHREKGHSNPLNLHRGSTKDSIPTPWTSTLDPPKTMWLEIIVSMFTSLSVHLFLGLSYRFIQHQVKVLVLVCLIHFLYHDSLSCGQVCQLATLWFELLKIYISQIRLWAKLCGWLNRLKLWLNTIKLWSHQPEAL